ncbi:hypothetical protein [Enterobacter kobei]|uniref:hypothetical protein n=1 Tax=Enterobacter kobei TaxID=208224 RepID=UPI003CF66E85
MKYKFDRFHGFYIEKMHSLWGVKKILKIEIAKYFKKYPCMTHKLFHALVWGSGLSYGMKGNTAHLADI